MLVSYSERVTVSDNTCSSTNFKPHAQEYCATPLSYSKALTEVVRSGQLGDLINAVRIEHRPVGYFHCSVLRLWQLAQKV
jgi:hypothetical protein